MPILVKQKRKQQKTIYHTYVKSSRYSKRKSHDEKQYIKVIDGIIRYLGDIKQISVNDMFFDKRKEDYIRKLNVLKREVERNCKHHEYLPHIKTAHTALFGYAKKNKLKYSVPENGIDLMMLLISLYG